MSRSSLKSLGSIVVGAAFLVGAILALSATSALANARAQVFQAKVVAVSDGDTVRVQAGTGSQLRIRLLGIDAPELGHGGRPSQPFGAEARNALAGQIEGRRVQLNCPREDRYGRLVCVILKDGVDINLWMVEQGWAWAYRSSQADAPLAQAQTQARSAGRGLWQDAQPVEPRQWRQSR